MGGLLIVVVVLGIYFFLRRTDAATFAPLAALAGVGALGAFDDYLNARTGEGIKARQKLIWLTVVAFVAAYQIQQTYAITAIAVPFYGPLPIEPWLYVLFAAFAIIASANGVNITDGLDGLSGGTAAIAFVAYMLIALLNTPAQPNLGILLCALIIGALLGFLWFDVDPAQIFIGDSGALALGATLAVTFPGIPQTHTEYISYLLCTNLLCMRKVFSILLLLFSVAIRAQDLPYWQPAPVDSLKQALAINHKRHLTHGSGKSYPKPLFPW